MPDVKTTSKTATPHKFDLGFPIHGAESASVKLGNLKAFMEGSKLSEEYFLSGDATKTLENKVARMFGMEAALWCITGTMAQSIAARIYAERSGNKQLLLHPTSHLLLHEEDSYQYVHGLSAFRIGDISAPLAASDLSGDAACAFTELPQRHNGGALPSWEQLEAIKMRADKLELPLHMDGARIWSCRPHFGNRSYAEIAAGFSSIYVSLYKDIGALGGAILLGGHDFVAEAKNWRTRMGGLTAAAWPIVCDGLRLLDDRLMQMPNYVHRAKEIADAISHFHSIRVLPKPPQTNLFHIQLPLPISDAEIIIDDIAAQTEVRLGRRFWVEPGIEQCCRLEFTAGETALSIPDDLLMRALTMLSEKCART